LDSMSDATATGLTQEAFEAFLSSRLEPRWLTDMRRCAWKAFQDLPMPQDQPPGPQQEEWRRTDIRRFHFEKFPLPSHTRETGSIATGCKPILRDGVTPLLTVGVDLAGHASAIDSQPCQASWIRTWLRAACCSEA